MFKLSVLICCIYFCAVMPYLTSAVTPEQTAEIRSFIQSITKKCSEVNKLTEDDQIKLKSRKVPSGPEAPCYLACIMRSTGMMDDKGELAAEYTEEMGKPISNDADKFKEMQTFLQTCLYVSSTPVSDGEKGCERALLAYACMTENGLEGFRI